MFNPNFSPFGASEFPTDAESVFAAFFQPTGFAPPEANAGVGAIDPDIAPLNAWEESEKFGSSEGDFLTEFSLEDWQTQDSRDDFLTAFSTQPGDTLTTAIDLGVLAAPQQLNDFVGSIDPTDFYRFQINTPSNFNLVLNGMIADADVRLIRDENSNGIVDFGEAIDYSVAWGTTPEQIDRMLSPGIYYVEVDRYSGDTPYTLTLTANPIADSAGNTLSTARDLGSLNQPQVVSDFVSSFDFFDYYRITVETPGPLSLGLSGLRDNANLEFIYDANANGFVDFGEVLQGSYRSYSASEEIQMPYVAPGTYYVRVTSYSGDTNYTLHAIGDRYSTRSGYGLVDASAAVAQALGQLPVFPPIPDSPATYWGVDRANAPEVWAQGYTGQGVVVAVVDSGVDYTHPDLAGNMWLNADEIANNGIDDDGNGYVDDWRGWDFIQWDGEPIDLLGHGTNVAGTIAASSNGFGVTGIAPSATIMPVRVLDFEGKGSSWTIAQGIRYAANNGADIINLSLGTSYPTPETVAEIDLALQEAIDRGVVVVMAAGNEYAREPGYPANSATTWGLAVGASDISNAMPWFSNRAGSLLDYVVAPGVDIYSTTLGHSYEYLSGTSMATPHVAGVAALVLSANPNLAPPIVEAILTQSANPEAIA